MKIGDADLKSINYHFFDNQLYWVIIKYSYYPNNEIIVKTLDDKYGLRRRADYGIYYGFKGLGLEEKSEVYDYRKSKKYHRFMSGASTLNMSFFADGSCVINGGCILYLTSGKLMQKAVNFSKKVKK
ncbi:MAG: hypothetical protein LBH45_00910 [Campylobacteraceae bacterium]|nr:hypothetical protein [Campylobacteraceae bacterium]